MRGQSVSSMIERMYHMQPRHRATRPLTAPTLLFSAEVARVEIGLCGIGTSSGRDRPLADERVQIEFFATDAATWNRCQLAIGQAFPAGSGLRGDFRTGIFTLPVRASNALEAWLSRTFEAPAHLRRSSHDGMSDGQWRQLLGEIVSQAP